MKSLKNKYTSKTAVLIYGGPSCIDLLDRLSEIDRKKHVIFLDSKALTPDYFKNSPEPDFYLLPYPEKAKDNSLQNLVYQSLKVRVPIKNFIKKEYYPMVDEIVEKEEFYFIKWNPAKGPHKRIRYREDLYLKDSPMELLLNYNSTKIITIKEAFKREFPNIHLNNQFFYFEFNVEPPVVGDYLNYINPTEDGSRVLVNHNSYSNSAAACHFPLLNYMGFKDLCFIGYDMSQLGILEYNGLDTFKSFFHYRTFLFLIRHAIRHGNVRTNLHPYLRNRNEFIDLEKFIDLSDLNMKRVIGKKSLSGKVKNMPLTDFNELL